MAREGRFKSINEIMIERRGDLYRSSHMYKDNFADKRVTYYFFSKGVPKRRTIYFYKRNFMHLCGVSRYPGGWKKFYRDCLESKIRTSKARSIQPKYVTPKIDALESLPKLLNRKYVGFSDDSVVHKRTNYGELVRTREDMLALGTVEDRATGNQVPISLINLEVSNDGMKKATSNWNKVSQIKVRDIEKDETDTYQEERERDKEMRVKQEVANYKNKQKQKKKNKESKGV